MLGVYSQDPLTKGCSGGPPAPAPPTQKKHKDHILIRKQVATEGRGRCKASQRTVPRPCSPWQRPAWCVQSDLGGAPFGQGLPGSPVPCQLEPWLREADFSGARCGGKQRLRAGRYLPRRGEARVGRGARRADASARRSCGRKDSPRTADDGLPRTDPRGARRPDAWGGQARRPHTRTHKPTHRHTHTATPTAQGVKGGARSHPNARRAKLA